MEDVLILGLGSIGGLVALWLKRSGGANISAVTRSNYEEVHRHGLRIESSLFGHDTVTFRKLSSSTEASVNHHSYVIITTKALPYSHTTLIASLEGYIVEGEGGTAIVIIQNGVGVEDKIRERYPKNVILSCVAWVGATQISPGKVFHAVGNTITMGTFAASRASINEPRPRDRERLDTLTRILTNGGATVNAKYSHIDLQIDRWKKVAFNCTWNALTALTDLDTITCLESSPEAMPLARRLIKELAAIARALGYEIDPPEGDPANGDKSLDDIFVDQTRAMPGITTSMRADVQNKKRVEVEAILGYPLKQAKRLGIDSPVLETLHVLLFAIDARLGGCIQPKAP